MKPKWPVVCRECGHDCGMSEKQGERSLCWRCFIEASPTPQLGGDLPYAPIDLDISADDMRYITTGHRSKHRDDGKS